MKELKAMSIQVLEARVFFKTESIGKLVIDQLAVQHFTNGIYLDTLGMPQVP